MRLHQILFCILALVVSVSGRAVSAQEIRVPGSVSYLYHSCNMKGGCTFGGSLGHALSVPKGVPGQYFFLLGRRGNSPVNVRYPVVPPPGNVAYSGGDLGAPSGVGFKWFAAASAGQQDPSQYLTLPPGLVISLMHSRNQANSGILAFGQYNPATGPTAINGFVRRSGGDLGAPSGVGFVWYESTDTGNTDWSIIDQLPAGTVVGLRHTRNLRGVRNHFVWEGKYTCRSMEAGNPPAACDPVNPSILPPAGFALVQGGDLGAPSGVGFVWYQKL